MATPEEQRIIQQRQQQLGGQAGPTLAQRAGALDPQGLQQTATGRGEFTPQFVREAASQDRLRREVPFQEMQAQALRGGPQEGFGARLAAIQEARRGREAEMQQQQAKIAGNVAVAQAQREKSPIDEINAMSKAQETLLARLEVANNETERKAILKQMKLADMRMNRLIGVPDQAEQPIISPEQNEFAQRLQGLNLSGGGQAPAAPVAPAVSQRDQQALSWAREHPDDPRATAILQRLGAM